MIVFLGDAGIDHFVATGDERLGGCAATAALAAGDAARLIAAIGDDARGDRVREALGPLGRDLSRVPGRTPCQRIELTAAGERLLCGYDAGVLPDWRPDTAQRELVGRASIVHTVAFAQIMPLFEHVLTLPRKGLLFVDFMDLTDFGGRGEALEPYWGLIDGAFLGLGVGHALETFKRPGKTVVVTLGSAGSVCFAADGQSHECAATPVEHVVDTTGAGDTYAGTFLARLAAGAPISAAMGAAANAASRHISRRRD